MKSILITICARGGSKGIPGKNIKLLNGVPLLAYTIKHSQAFKAYLESLDFKVQLELSTDDNEIIGVAAQYGLHSAYKRPDFLASDNAGKLDAIKDLLIYSEAKEGKRFDFTLDLDVSAPMRSKSDLIEAFKIFRENKEALNLFSVSKAHKNPYFNMVEKAKDGYYYLSKKGEKILSRQSAPKVYAMNASFYFYRRAFFEASDLYLFNHSLIFEMMHESFDLDDPIDFEFLAFLIKNDKLSFEI
jgi:CMP-N,N'-diacetyllegionaminic acid synthase